MGMGRPEIFKLLKNCPKGTETLITRITEQSIDYYFFCLFFKNSYFHFLAPSSPELVEKVRDLYHKQVSDVRFLIPVLTGLEKVC